MNIGKVLDNAISHIEVLNGGSNHEGFNKDSYEDIIKSLTLLSDISSTAKSHPEAVMKFCDYINS